MIHGVKQSGGSRLQSAEHLDVPTDATLWPTNQQVNNQPEPVSHWSTNQPDKIAATKLSFMYTNIYVFIIEIG